MEGNYTKGSRNMSAMLTPMRILEQDVKFVQSVKYGCEIAGLRPGPTHLSLEPLTS